jgi:hypothetical protein
VVAWSSSGVDPPGIAERTLRDPFAGRIQSGFSDSDARLRSELDLGRNLAYETWPVARFLLIR